MCISPAHEPNNKSTAKSWLLSLSHKYSPSNQYISGCNVCGAKRKRAFQRKHEEKTVSSLCWPSTSMHGQTTISDSIVLLRWTRPPIRPQECVCLCILFFVFVHLLGVFGWASYQVYMPLCIFLCICVFLSGTSQMVSPTEYSINLSDARSEQPDSIRQNHCKWYQRFFALLNIQCFETSLLSGNVCFSSQSTSG